MWFLPFLVSETFYPFTHKRTTRLMVFLKIKDKVIKENEFFWLFDLKVLQIYGEGYSSAYEAKCSYSIMELL